jgi:hypothetical protein
MRLGAMRDTHDDAARMFALRAWDMPHTISGRNRHVGIAVSTLHVCERCASGARQQRLSLLRLARSTAENVVGAFSSGVIGDIPADRITGMTPFTRELLARAQYAVAEGRDLRAGELGDLFVCTPAARSVKVRSKACVRAVAQF